MLGSERRIDGSIEFSWPARTSAWVIVRKDLQIQGCQVVACGQGRDISLFSPADELPMRANEAADGRVRQDVRVLRLPAEQPGDGGKGHLLGQQAGPRLQATRDQDAVMRREHSVGRHHMLLRGRMDADLARQVERGHPLGEATGDRERLMAIAHNRFGGKTLAVLLRQRSIERLPLCLQDASQDRLARISPGSTCEERQDLALLPVALPAAIEH